MSNTQINCLAIIAGGLFASLITWSWDAFDTGWICAALDLFFLDYFCGGK